MIFSTKKTVKGFTLIELMVVIALIGMITLGATQINFNTLSDRQRLDIFTNEIASKIETVRNNALIGKGTGINVETPDRWRIEVSTTGSGSMETSYDIGGVWNADNEQSINLGNFYSIDQVDCVRLDGSKETLSATGILLISGKNMSLSGCSDNNYKVLEISTKYKENKKIISINTLSGLVEVN